MNFDNFTLRNDEKAIFALRSLYGKYGYFQYKMSKFEEYDLYAGNKDFLVSDSVITFTDTNGKLMALKPDVTLSIVKNISDDSSSVQKVFYNENVYRTSKGTKTFKEIMQSGLECIGQIDSYNVCEVTMLAKKSLNVISPNNVLDLSHMGVIYSAVDDLNLDPKSKSDLLFCISQKNLGTALEICTRENADEAKSEILKKIITLPEDIPSALPVLDEIAKASPKTSASIEELKTTIDFLEKNGCGDNLRIDFSVILDSAYYNGIVFKGFIQGIPSAVLSGGRYDMLMKKMKKNAGAIGFAVYLDMLERLNSNSEKYDIDVVLLYDSGISATQVGDAVALLSDTGKSVTAQNQIPKKLRYKQLLKLNGKGIEIIENNA